MYIFLKEIMPVELKCHNETLEVNRRVLRSNSLKEQQPVHSRDENKWEYKSALIS